VYPSTNMVFDGKVGFCTPEARTCPNTEYGRQKNSAEIAVRSLCLSYGIVRFGKILPPAFGLFEAWSTALENGDKIQAFADVLISPVTSDAAALALSAAGDVNRAGIWHFTASDEVSYYEIALWIAGQVGASRSLVVPARFHEGVSDMIAHSTLDGRSFHAEFGIESRSSWEAIAEYWRKRESS